MQPSPRLTMVMPRFLPPSSSSSSFFSSPFFSASALTTSRSSFFISSSPTVRHHSSTSLSVARTGYRYLSRQAHSSVDGRATPARHHHHHHPSSSSRPRLIPPAAAATAPAASHQLTTIPRPLPHSSFSTRIPTNTNTTSTTKSRTMSAATIPIPRIQPAQLADLLLSSNPNSSSDSDSALPSDIAIIDVRDRDHIGGHIHGSTHVPSSTLSHATPELVRTLQGKKKVVFHCMLSQERGPNAARKYLLCRERMGLPVGGAAGKKDGEGEGEGDEQEVVVLEGGFVEWGKLYGKDKRLTKAFVEELWEGGW